MYNEEVKQRFIEHYFVTRKTRTDVYATMNAVAPLEEFAGVDIAQMNDSEGIAAVSRLDLNSLGTIYVRRVVIRDYLDWCRDNHVFDPVKDGFFNALSPNLDISPAVARMIFRDDGELCASMRKVVKFDEGYFEPVVLALAWLGLSVKDIMELKDGEIDLDRRVIYDHAGNIMVPWFSPHIHEVLYEYANTKMGFRDNRQTSYQVVKDYSFDGFIKRFASPDSDKIGKPFTKENIQSGVNRLNTKYVGKGYPPRLTYSNVWKSGRFYALWELECAGVNVLDSENKDKVTGLFGTMNYRHILWFYKAYKRAFNL